MGVMFSLLVLLIATLALAVPTFHYISHNWK
jgi:hypothetical protein